MFSRSALSSDSVGRSQIGFPSSAETDGWKLIGFGHVSFQPEKGKGLLCARISRWDGALRMAASMFCIALLRELLVSVTYDQLIMILSCSMRISSMTLLNFSASCRMIVVCWIMTFPIGHQPRSISISWCDSTWSQSRTYKTQQPSNCFTFRCFFGPFKKEQNIWIEVALHDE